MCSPVLYLSWFAFQIICFELICFSDNLFICLWLFNQIANFDPGHSNQLNGREVPFNPQTNGTNFPQFQCKKFNPQKNAKSSTHWQMEQTFSSLFGHPPLAQWAGWGATSQVPRPGTWLGGHPRPRPQRIQCYLLFPDFLVSFSRALKAWSRKAESLHFTPFHNVKTSKVIIQSA